MRPPDDTAAAIGSEGVDPAEVARIVAETPEATLRELLTGEVRAAALDEVIRRFPEFVDERRASGSRAAVEWRIIDGRRADRFALVFGEDGVRAGRELDPEPRVTLELDTVDFLRLATANADPATLFLSGRLRLSGDELFAIEMASFLRIPGTEGERPAESATDPSVVDADRIAAVVGEAPDEALRRGMSGAIRGLILDEVIRRFPDYVRRSRAAGFEAAIGWTITGRADGGADRFQVVIADGEVTAGRDLNADPRVTLILDGVQFLKLVTGNANPAMSFVTGKLKIRGDLGFAAQLPGLFRMPSAAN
jgi:putative sterol carrier protein